MKGFPLPSRAYIVGTVLLGAVLAGGGMYDVVRSLDARQDLLLIGLAVVASAAQVRMVVGPTKQSSYNLGLVVYSFALATLGTESAVVVALAASVVEWAWHRYPWFTQSFNIGCLAIALSLSGLVHDLVLGGRSPSGPAGTLALIAAVAVFLLVNHLMVGIVIRLSRGESFAESGVFGRLTLVIDGTLLVMGVSAALLWQMNPSVFFIAVAPLYLIAVTLRVPALERQAATDPKTGLFNTRYFREALERELSRANRFDRPLTVVVGDLDLLRNVNNLYGHLAGDDVLVAVAEILRTSVREYDVVARFGGEEFTILMPEVPLAEAVPRVEAIRAAIAAREVAISGSSAPIRVTMSFGLSERLQSEDTPHDLLHRADIAVYRAKLEGRNRVCVIRTEDSVWDADYQIERMESFDVHDDDVGPMPCRDRLAASERGVSPADAGADRGASDEGPLAEDPTVKDGLRVSSPGLRTANARGAQRLRMLVWFVTLAALGVLGFSLRHVALPDLGLTEPTGLLLFALICILAESLAMDIYVRETSVSTSAAPFVAGVLLFGPVGVFVLGVVLAGAAMLKHHSPLSRFLFNASLHVLTGLAIVWLAALVGFTPGIATVWAEAGMCVFSGYILYVVTTGLISVAIGLDVGVGIKQTWIEHFRWLAPYYLALGVLSYTLLFGYTEAGLSGVLIAVVPMLVLRVGQKQYISHTRSLVAALRLKNQEIGNRAGEVSRLNEELFVALANAVDARDPYVVGHSQHVARYASLISREMRLSPERTDLVRRAGLLHDIGKLGVPDGILFKAGRLTCEEYEIVKRHSFLGGEILSSSELLRPLVTIVRHHHERWDGCGYPDGLTGRATPVEARILAVADAVEAMASDRPYREGSIAREIREEIERHAGTQFDPEVVAAFGRVLRREGDSMIVNSAVEVHPAAPEHISGNEAARRPAFA